MYNRNYGGIGRSQIYSELFTSIIKQKSLTLNPLLTLT